MRYHRTQLHDVAEASSAADPAGWPQDGEAGEKGRCLSPEAFCCQGLGGLVCILLIFTCCERHVTLLQRFFFADV